MVDDKVLLQFATQTILNYWNSCSDERKIQLMHLANAKENNTSSIIPDTVFVFLFNNPGEMK